MFHCLFNGHNFVVLFEHHSQSSLINLSSCYVMCGLHDALRLVTGVLVRIIPPVELWLLWLDSLNQQTSALSVLVYRKSTKSFRPYIASNAM